MIRTKGRQNVLPEQEKEKKFAKELNSCYEFLSVCLPAGSLICLLVVLVLDFVPFPYCCTAVENFFCNRDISPLVSTSLVIWTFGATLMVYFMGRIEDQRFGIRFYEAMLAHERKLVLVAEILLFLAEVVLLEIGAAYGLPITLFTVCMLQPLNIIYIFLMITQETSQSKVVNTINCQTKAVLERLVEQQLAEQPGSSLKNLEKAFETEQKDWLLLKVLRSINYNSHGDLDDLLDCLSAEQWEPAQNYPEVLLVVSWYLAYCMLDGGRTSIGERAVLPPALATMFKEIVSDPHYPDFVKLGIIMALPLNRESADHDKLFLDLLALAKLLHQGALIAWTSYILEKLVDSEDEDLLWRKSLLNDVNDLKDNVHNYNLNKQGKSLLDRYLAWLGFTETTYIEDSLEPDLEEVSAGCV